LPVTGLEPMGILLGNGPEFTPKKQDGGLTPFCELGSQ